MAIDKAVDSAQLNAALTSVANAIRTKGGTSASLTFPQGFVDAVEAIQTGGGGSGVIIKSGTFTPAADLRAGDVTIQHNLGEIPQVVIINSDMADHTTGLYTIYGCYNAINAETTQPNDALMATTYIPTTTRPSTSTSVISATNKGRAGFLAALTSTQMCAIAYNNNYKYEAGVTYTWVAIAGVSI